MYLKKDDKIINVRVVGTKVLITTKINGHLISNPELEDMLADGWVEFTPPAPAIEQLSEEEMFKRRLVPMIRARYDINDELGILRQRNIKPEEFEEYNTFVEQCKESLRGNNQASNE